jgi:rubrerythrin
MAMVKHHPESNTNYNLMTQLTRKLSFIWRVEQYIKDAKKAKLPDVADLWIRIHDDEKRHVDMLRAALDKHSRDGKLRFFEP